MLPLLRLALFLVAVQLVLLSFQRIAKSSPWGIPLPWHSRQQRRSSAMMPPAEDVWPFGADTCLAVDGEGNGERRWVGDGGGGGAGGAGVLEAGMRAAGLAVEMKGARR